MSPVRIQRRRTRGWRMPEGAIYVGRPTQWGNPFMVAPASVAIAPSLARYVVDQAYRAWVTAEVHEHLTIDRAPLRGRDLACWCRLDRPCHADVLLELANA